MSQNLFNQLHEFQNSISEETAKDSIDKLKTKLKDKFPHLDDFGLDYWALRILFFTDWDTDNLIISMDGPDEPSKISLTYYPDYSS